MFADSFLENKLNILIKLIFHSVKVLLSQQPSKILLHCYGVSKVSLHWLEQSSVHALGGVPATARLGQVDILKLLDYNLHVELALLEDFPDLLLLKSPPVPILTFVVLLE